MAQVRHAHQEQNAPRVYTHILLSSHAYAVVMCMQGSWDMMGQQNPTGPALWSAEDPNLYILVLSLLSPDGAHVESESCQVQQHLD